MVPMNFTFFILFRRPSAADPVGSVLSCSSVSIIAQKSVNTASTDLSNDNQRVRQAFFSFFATCFLPAEFSVRFFVLSCTLRYVAVRFAEFSNSFHNWCNCSSQWAM